ncbi:MAG: histidine kinase [Bacteroidota bacterium]
MSTKTIVSLGKQTLLTFIIVTVTIYIFGFFAFGGSIKQITSDFIEVLPFMIPFLLIPFAVFHYVNHKMIVKKVTHKIYPYFLYTLLIPMLFGGVISVIGTYLRKGEMNFLVILVQVATLGIILLFFALFYFIKYNYSDTTKNRSQAFLDVKTPYKTVALYAVGLALLNAVFQSIVMIRFSLSDFFLIFVDSILVAMICWYLVYMFNRYVEKKLSSPILVISSILLIVVGMQPILTGINYIQLSMMGEEAIPFNDFSIYSQIRFNLLQSIFVVFTVVFYQLLYLSKARTIEQQAFKATLGKQTEKYENLRRQLSPHFLFNNINVLTALIEEDPKRAVHFSESLGNIYRHFLRQEDEDIVLLENALSFSEDYLKLLKYRYENALHYVLPEIVTPNLYIIPLALQQVIENTIKHNEVSIEKPLQITIGIINNYLIIQNTKQLKTTGNPTKGTGIENIQKWYAFLTEKEVIIEDEMNSFTIKLPLLNMENA